jgi:hypothetical protein
MEETPQNLPEIIQGKFYISPSEQNKVYFCTKQGTLIDYLDNEINNPVRGLAMVESAADYMRFLLNDSQRFRDYALFMQKHSLPILDRALEDIIKYQENALNAKKTPEKDECFLKWLINLFKIH